MRVWVVGRGVPDKKNGMLGSFELEQAQMLKKNGIDVAYFAVSVRSSHNLSRVGFHFFELGGVPIASFNFPIGRLFSSEKTKVVFEKAFKRMAGIMIKKYGKPDIIHVHYPAQRLYKAFVDLQESGVKIVATEHWTKVQDKTIGKTYLNNLRDFVLNSDSFICVSSTLRQSVEDITGVVRQIYVVPNIVNTNFHCAQSKRTGFHFVVSGRLVELKQVDKVVEAFISVFENTEDVYLTVAGGGEQYNLLKTYVATAGRESQISLLGFVSREKMAEIMSSSDVLVSYSRLETFCVPVIEAWMCGKPVIASKTIPAMIDNPDTRLGMTVDEYEIETLKSALRTMYENYEECDPEWIAEYARENFSESAVARRLMEIYQKY